MPVPAPVVFDRWTYAARVLSVHDGDTIRAAIDVGFDLTFTTTLRLLGIQAPEVGGPNVSAAEKVAGQAARAALVAILDRAGGSIFVRTVKDSQEGRGRYLAMLVLGDGVNVNAQLVALGHATEYDGHGKAPKWTPAGWVPASEAPVAPPATPRRPAR